MNTGIITSEFPLRRLGRDFDAFLDQFSPALEICEKGGRLIVRADVPGLRRDAIKVEVSEHELTIEGERTAERDDKASGFYRSERAYGSFFRSIALPEGVDVARATATVKDGVLEIIMPIAKGQTNKRRVPIAEAAP
jgi:HSP20 family protein